MQRPDTLPTREEIESLPEPTEAEPLRVIVSGCLTGRLCGWDGSDCGSYHRVRRLLARPNVLAASFCPEDHAFGTPRELSDIVGGNGFDVLDGRARVMAASGADWTEMMIASARAMLDRARMHRARLALLLDISAACGSQVIHDGNRMEGRYRKGPGVAAAMLARDGIKVLSQRDERTLSWIELKVMGASAAIEEGIDHHESDWYRSYFTE